MLLSDTFLRFNLKIPQLGLICSLVQVSRIRVRGQVTGLMSQLHTSENSFFFPKILRCNLTYYEGENFSDSFFHHIFESENSLTWGVKCGKLDFTKILGNLLDEF